MTTTDAADPTDTPPDAPTRTDAWYRSESGFQSADHTRLYYRCRQPLDTRRTPASPPLRVLVFLHDDHQHSGHLQALADELLGFQDWSFAWDARGHGHSPGDHDATADIDRLVQDFHHFTRHLRQTLGLSTEDMVVVAHGLGALVAATWVHDHAPCLRGLVLAAAAFQPKAWPARFTALARQRATTARRIVANAAAIDVPTLVLVAGEDSVVHPAAQLQFFDHLGARQKRLVQLPHSDHEVFHGPEAPREEALRETWRFIHDCYGQPMATREDRLDGDRNSRSATQFQHLQRDTLGSSPARLGHALQRHLLHALGPYSDGLRAGLAYGFDAGVTQDHVYRREASGRAWFGRWLDQRYLHSPGSRALQQRQQHLQHVLTELIATHPGSLMPRVLDVAAGGGRYLLETAKRFQDRPMRITLRDQDQASLDAAARLVDTLALNHTVEYQCRDALSPDSYPVDEPLQDIVVVSGLFELVSENAPVLAALQGIQRQLHPGGHLVYTGLPWHPDWLRQARILNDRRGEPLQMRLRPQVELDALVASIDCRKVLGLIGPDGVHTVSVARFEPDHTAPIIPPSTRTTDPVT
ncbi:class I SAM-dependent methyltransferase family protein [Sphaerotilus sp.]|uniref:class I SAM-dependent methyltransferase family protein n=1 Tax=Sphaerotilus sp. TaxID=2093942 RepID=UPI002ACEF6B4|nr:class I SAM-dependent methyltransferase family protein [Sphaerotilus sp.]MDZ7855417.1 class I SAM-dependent methyltransferase family protein [Sphaerotilus sp.]